MAQYEANEEQIQELTDSSTGLSDATKEAIKSLANSGSSVAVVSESASGTVSDSGVVASNATLSNLTLSNAVALAVDGSSGSLTSTNSAALTADLVNSDVTLTINNNAANTVNVSGATGGGVTAGHGDNLVNVVDASNVSVDLGDGANSVNLGGSTGTSNVDVNLGAGNNNVNIGGEGANGVSVSTGNGNNNISVGNAMSSAPFNVSVTTGDGDDTMDLQGNVNGQFTSGAGDLEISLDATAQEQAQISVDAGEGFDLLRLIGRAVKHAFEFVNGRFHMHSGDVSMDGVNVVATDMNGDGLITQDMDHITVLATTEEDSLIAKLYKVALGREAIDGSDGWSADGSGDTLGGFNWWTNEYEKSNDITDHNQLVRAFLNCSEFHTKYDALDDTAYVNQLFSNLGVSDVEAAQSYINSLKNGSMDRYDVARAIAESDQAVQLLGNDGDQYVIDGDYTTNA